MASRLYTITPNTIDNSGDNWSIAGGLTGAATIATTSATKYLYGTEDEINTFGFTNTGVTPVSVDWIQFYMAYGSSVANEPMQIRINIVDGADSSILHTETLNITGPSNTGKNNQYYSGLYPYHSGTTAWSISNIENLKMQAQVYDNSVGDGNVGNQLELHYFQYEVMLNLTNTNIRQNISTYKAKKGMSVSKGVVKIG